MNIAFFIGEMNLRGVANSTYQYSIYNKKILKNKSIIFYDKSNHRNDNQVIKKFKKKFNVIGIDNLEEIDSYKYRLSLDYLYIQKSGQKDKWQSKNIKTIIHSVYPQKLNQVHGDRYAYISEWLSNQFSRNKVPFVPYIVKIEKNKNDLKAKLRIKKNQIVFGCHGGHSSFDLKFAQDTIFELVNKRKDITFIFLNINKFCKHPRVIFLRGTADEKFKNKFINTCDGMIYGRSLGESFGIACGEFSVQGKKIICYRFNRHRSHVKNISNNNFIEYSSRKELSKIFENFSKKKISLKNNYFNYKPHLVMKSFQKIFLKRNEDIDLSIIDYSYNLFNFFAMHYRYFCHKFYNHYYNFFESKFIFRK